MNIEIAVPAADHIESEPGRIPAIMDAFGAGWIDAYRPIADSFVFIHLSGLWFEVAALHLRDARSIPDAALAPLSECVRAMVSSGATGCRDLEVTREMDGELVRYTFHAVKAADRSSWLGAS